MPAKLSSNDNLEEIVNDPDFVSHCLTLACLCCILETFGILMVGVPSIGINKLWAIDPKFIIIAIYLS